MTGLVLGIYHNVVYHQELRMLLLGVKRNNAEKEGIEYFGVTVRPVGVTKKRQSHFNKTSENLLKCVHLWTNVMIINQSTGDFIMFFLKSICI